MNTTTQHRTRTAIAAGVLGLGALALVPSPAQANRIPADPVVTFVATPPGVASLAASAHAQNMRSTLQDFRSSGNVPTSASPTASLAAAAHGDSVRAALQDLR